MTIHDLRVILASSRPVSWVNTAYPFAAGYLVAGQGVDVRLIVGSLFFLIPYNLLMYGVNDVFDYESDLRNPRKGGIEGIKLKKRLHRPVLLAAVVSSLPFIIYLLSVGHLAANVVLLLVIATVIAYSAPRLRFKEIPFLDSVTSSSHFTGPLLYGLVLAGWHPAYWPAVAALFAWGMASHAFGAVQDMHADRAAGIGSVATVIGAKATVVFSLALYLIAIGLVLSLGPYSLAVAAAGLLYVANVVPFIGLADAKADSAHAGWRRFLYLNYVTGAIVTISLLYAGLHT